MQGLLYRWLLLMGAGHVLLGIVLAFAAHLPLTQGYFDYLYAARGLPLPSPEQQVPLRTLVGLFGPTVASWGLLFCALLVIYRRHGLGLIKPVLIAALLLWSLLDSAFSIAFGFTLHAYLNGAAALAMGIPLLALRPATRPRSPALTLRHDSGRRLRVLITGGSGFIGSPLATALSQAGHEVLILTRDLASLGQVRGRISALTDLAQIASDERIDCLINLAGEPLAGQRWNPARKQRFLSSRLDTTDALLQLVQRLEHKPEVLLSGSAVGYYGHWQDEPLDEDSEAHDGFSHRLCAQWEARALQMQALGLRVCLLRIGIVLGRDGGPLAEFKRPFELGVASQLGDGRQWMPWIHLDDVLDICSYLMHTPLSGPINLTAPEPVSHQDFCQALQRQVPWARLRLKVPAALVRLLLGEMADEVLLTGQRVVPTRLLQSGYRFRYPQLQPALQQLLARR
ncbi:Epimerase family protein [Pseudomonas sp. THAF187a]|uniref:TIGR01777 family oxidoreductase n=1 Tax=unclassified Pseudomonas TaxID=196821 RepID=UPI0012693267|nr:MULTISPECIES: TIGR01777 family oxidoreductase [unclassified Pseudomonas]QFT21751.1 Epimerase family protein [Pseudomonas sp. THAF187a]QFT41938.1 Epimerase family protein [Pseudomonas sp. THAF42]